MLTCTKSEMIALLGEFICSNPDGRSVERQIKVETMDSKYVMLIPVNPKINKYETRIFGGDYPISTQRFADS